MDYENFRTSYFRNIYAGPGSDSVIRCVTYNIQLGFPAWADPWNKDETGATREQILKISGLLSAFNPDIIALQEVPRNRYNAEVKFFLDSLASVLNMNYAFGSHGYNDPNGIYPVYGEWGTAILSRFKIKSIKNTQIEYINKWEKRSMLDAELEINDSVSIHALSLHYLPSDQAIPNTTAYLKQLNGAAIVMGDFNYIGEIPDFNEAGFRDVDSTYEKNWIDRIFYTSVDFQNLGYGTLIDTIGISDHSPNYGILKMKFKR